MRFTKTIIALTMISTIFGQAIPKITLKDVLVEGNVRASERVIRTTSRLLPGKTITAIDIQRGIRKMWDLSLFGDIQIYVEDESEEGMTIRIVVVEHPSLEEVEFVGNKRMSKNKLKHAIDMSPPTILSDFAVEEAKRKIKKRYYESGYLNAEVKAELLPGEKPEGRNLRITITENKKVRLRRIRFEGNENVSRFKLRTIMKSTKQWRWYFFWRDPYDWDKYQEDLASVIDYYQNNGYRDARVVSDTLQIIADDGGQEIVVTIGEGKKYYYRDFIWEGNTLYTNERLENALGISRGASYNKAAFAEAVGQRVHPVYMDEGYLYSRVEPSEFPVGEDSVDVIFSIVENQKVSIRYIKVLGNDQTRDYVIRRELRMNPGDIFSYSMLTRSQRDVWILNFFENVEPDVVPIDEDHIDVTIKVTERSSNKANFSIGYTEQFGMIGGGGLELSNLMGTGQRLNLSYNRGAQSLDRNNPYSQQAAYTSINLSWMNPWMFNTPNLLGASIFKTERGSAQATASLYLPFDIVQQGGSVQWGRRFRWPDSFFRGVWMTRLVDKGYIGDIDDLTNSLGSGSLVTLDSLGNGRGKLSTVGVAFIQTITRDSRDRPEFPTMGSEFRWVSTLSGIFLGGDEDYHKHVFDFKWYSPIRPKFVFYQAMKMGMIKQVVGKSGSSIMPPTEKFYMGGSGIPFGEMLRGYPDNSVGPYSGGPLGGTVTLKYTSELRFSVSDNPTIYLLAFGEMGNTWLNFDQVDPYDLKMSAGVGMRVFMPMLGMLGLDAGYGFQPAGNESGSNAHGWELHFLFGGQF